MTPADAMTYPVRCNDCGPLRILLDDAVITTADVGVRLTFPCPRCSVPTSSFVHPAWVSDLVECGVPYVELPPRPTRNRPAVTEGECDRFDAQVEKAHDLAGIAGAYTS